MKRILLGLVLAVCLMIPGQAQAIVCAPGLFACTASFDGVLVEWCCPYFSLCGQASSTHHPDGSITYTSGGCVSLIPIIRV